MDPKKYPHTLHFLRNPHSPAARRRASNEIGRVIPTFSWPGDLADWLSAHTNPAQEDSPKTPPRIEWSHNQTCYVFFASPRVQTAAAVDDNADEACQFALESGAEGCTVTPSWGAWTDPFGAMHKERSMRIEILVSRHSAFVPETYAATLAKIWGQREILWTTHSATIHTLKP